MATPTIEERLTAVEAELAQLKKQVEANNPPITAHPWNKIFGSFAKSEGFEEAVRLGREYRDSLRPKEDEDTN